MPRRRADDFQPFTSAADQDSFLPLPFDGDAGTNSDQFLAFFEGFDPHGHCVGNFLSGVCHHFLTNDFSDQKAFRLVGSLIFRKVGLALRQVSHESFERKLDAVTGESGHGNYFGK